MALVDEIPVLLATQPKTTPRWSTKQYAVLASLSWKVYLPSCSDHSGSSSSRCQWRGRVREGEEHVIFFFVARGEVRQRNRVVVARERRAGGEGRGARLRHRFADPRPPSAVVRHERDPCPWSCRPSFGTYLRELREHLRRCLLWVLEGRGRLVVGPHGPAAPHEGVKDSRSGLHILSLSLSLSLSGARAPAPGLLSLPPLRQRSTLPPMRFKNSLPSPLADPLGN